MKTAGKLSVYQCNLINFVDTNLRKCISDVFSVSLTTQEDLCRLQTDAHTPSLPPVFPGLKLPSAWLLFCEQNFRFSSWDQMNSGVSSVLPFLRSVRFTLNVGLSLTDLICRSRSSFILIVWLLTHFEWSEFSSVSQQIRRHAVVTVVLNVFITAELFMLIWRKAESHVLNIKLTVVFPAAS